MALQCLEGVEGDSVYNPSQLLAELEFSVCWGSGLGYSYGVRV